MVRPSSPLSLTMVVILSLPWIFSVILNCVQCKIAVHARCYGEAECPNETWKCRRCAEQDYLAECCLCNLRGGALKKTTHYRWAHIVCAMAIPQVYFENVTAREPIDVQGMPTDGAKSKCFFCAPFVKTSKNCTGLIQCSVSECALAFHVTCAQSAGGVIIEPLQLPSRVYATCTRHAYQEKSKCNNPATGALCVGESVVAKHPNGRYYRSSVVGHHEQVFYQVKFDDGSVSRDLYPQDIENRDCLSNGPPEKGAEVQVRWPDQRTYNATYIGSNTVTMWEVAFEFDRSVARVKRQDLYSDGEPLPKKVRTRLSKVSDLQQSDVMTNRLHHALGPHVSSTEPASVMDPCNTTNAQVHQCNNTVSVREASKPEARSVNNVKLTADKGSSVLKRVRLPSVQLPIEINHDAMYRKLSNRLGRASSVR